MTKRQWKMLGAGVLVLTAATSVSLIVLAVRLVGGAA